jgi:hypothetical protein
LSSEKWAKWAKWARPAYGGQMLFFFFSLLGISSGHGHPKNIEVKGPKFCIFVFGSFSTVLGSVRGHSGSNDQNNIF